MQVWQVSQCVVSLHIILISASGGEKSICYHTPLKAQTEYKIESQINDSFTLYEIQSFRIYLQALLSNQSSVGCTLQFLLSLQHARHGLGWLDQVKWPQSRGMGVCLIKFSRAVMGRVRRIFRKRNSPIASSFVLFSLCR